MSELVCQLLEVLWLQAAGVLNDVVARGVDGPLPDRLRHEEEIVSREREKLVEERKK